MRYPRHMTLELTAKCNFRCPYCYCVWHEYPALAKPEFDADGWKAILDKCAADGANDILFTGGEALLRDDLFEIFGKQKAWMKDEELCENHCRRFEAVYVWHVVWCYGRVYLRVVRFAVG